MFSRLRTLLRNDPLQNTGSQARDLLALERTFLSWSRSGLAFIGLGIALEKVEALADLSPTLLHLENSRTKLAAGILVATGAGFIAHGTRRYFSTLRDLRQGVVRANGLGIVMFAGASVGVGIAGCALVVENDGGREREGVKVDGK